MAILFWLLLLGAYLLAALRLYRIRLLIGKYGAEIQAGRKLSVYTTAGSLLLILCSSGQGVQWLPTLFYLLPGFSVAGGLLAFLTFKVKEAFEAAGTSSARPAEDACWSLVMCHIGFSVLSGVIWVFQRIHLFAQVDRV